MLELTIPEKEFYDERKNEFIYYPGLKLTLEHSLISISKWEARWKKPFLSKESKTQEEFLDYIKDMTVTKNVDEGVYKRLGNRELQKVLDYIADPATATTFSDLRKNQKPGRKETITSELIYYWMDISGIPYEAEKWNLNRLLTLIHIHDVKENSQKMSKKDIYARNKALNAQRRAKSGSKG